MAGKNQVTLTFAGESKQLEETVDRATTSTSKFEEGIDRAGAGADRFSQGLGAGRRSSEDYARGLDRLEESGGTAETRFLGLGAGISGTSALMQGGKLDAEGMAMAFADLGDFTEHTVAPAMKGVKDRVGGAIASFKEGGGASEFFKRNLAGIAAGAVAAGGAVALLTMHFTDNAQRAEEARQRNQEWADRLDELGGNVNSLTSDLIANDDEFDQLRSRMNDVGLSTDQVTQAIERNDGSLSRLLQTEELSKGQKVALMQEIGILQSGIEGSTSAYEDNTNAAEGTAEATRDATEAARDYVDTLAAQMDPIFGMIDAISSNEEALRSRSDAQRAVNEAVAEFGPGSEEALEAERALADAHVAAGESAQGLESATASLLGAVESGDVSFEEATARLAAWEAQGTIDASTADYLRDRINGLTGAAENYRGDYRGNLILAGYETSIRKLNDLNMRLSDLDGETKTVYIRQVFQSYGQAEINRGRAGMRNAGGGIVPQYLASGGIGGPMGTDTIPAWLTPGEMVLNKAQQAELFAVANGQGAGGGPNVTVNVQGNVITERDLVRMIRDEIDRGGLGGGFR